MDAAGTRHIKAVTVAMLSVAVMALPADVWHDGPRSLLAATATPAPQATTTGPAPPNMIAVPAGWNIVAVTHTDTPVATPGLLFTFQAGDTAYEDIQQADTRPGVGYWAYFPHPSALLIDSTLPCGVMFGPDPCGTPIALPVGQWVMIGNPASGPVNLSGADMVEVYDPSSDSYHAVSRLYAGQGAIAYSANGGELTFSNCCGPGG